MSKNLYVGNLSFDTTEDDLREAFGATGCITSINVVTDRDTGRSRGFAFVEMATDAEAEAVISSFDGAEFAGRALTVNVARPRESRGGGGGGRSSGRRDGGGHRAY
ncbi:MAG TPA: RNA-binding protein [Myxococcota bacterium]|nr:RNA-binding protein [Myxococcota bacterium]